MKAKCPQCGSNRVNFGKNGMASCSRCGYEWNPALGDLNGVW